MQAIPYISISNGIPVIFLPLVVIIAITALKDLFEDYKRRKSDHEENSQNIEVFDNELNQFVWKQWKQLRVGQIIKVYLEKYVPADILILNSSQNGQCFIETKNLDGETNLKKKISPKLINDKFKNEKDISTNRIMVTYDRPNPFLYNFSGSAKTQNNEIIQLDNNNIIIRGCSLKNTKYIIGLVLYTGHETKILLNSYSAKSKKSQLERRMNKLIIFIMILQICICLFCSVVYLFWYNYNQDHLPYLEIDKTEVKDHQPVYNLFVRYGNWTLIFTNFVPISLLVSLEMVKFIQGYFIVLDTDMCLNIEQDSTQLKNSSENCNKSRSDLSTRSQVQSSNLNEELGQVKHIFSDKTGTLTCNVMDFKKIIIAGQTYGEIKEDNSNKIQNMNEMPEVTNVNFQD